MFHLFDDAVLHRHLKSLEKLPPPKATKQTTTTKARPARKPKAPGIHLGTMVANHGLFAYLKPDVQPEGCPPDSDLWVHKSQMERGLAAREGNLLAARIRKTCRRRRGEKRETRCLI